jgi:hypothetical protein
VVRNEWDEFESQTIVEKRLIGLFKKYWSYKGFSASDLKLK